jgi:hypothetical protein
MVDRWQGPLLAYYDIPNYWHLVLRPSGTEGEGWTPLTCAQDDAAWECSTELGSFGWSAW